jgi:hypothetical protein
MKRESAQFMFNSHHPVFLGMTPRVFLIRSPRDPVKGARQLSARTKTNSKMRLPRRVPWASIGELEQLCGWIYADENDYQAKSMAINRVRSHFS